MTLLIIPCKMQNKGSKSEKESQKFIVGSRNSKVVFKKHDRGSYNLTKRTELSG